MHGFIPLIRFHDIESSNFLSEVYCYKEILPQDLIQNLLEFHLVLNVENITPSRELKLKFKLDSSLIETKHIFLFASWIDKRKFSHHDEIPYKFYLLYHSSRFNAALFHENCDNKGATI